MTPKKPLPEIGRRLGRAVAKATGLTMVRSAILRAEHDDVIEITVTFLASTEQMTVIGQELAASQQAPEAKA